MTSRSYARLFLVVISLASASAGCVVVPVISPPARIAQSGGFAAGRLAPTRASAVEQSVAPVVTTRLGLHPLQAFPSLFTRRFDLGAGYLFEVMPEPGLSSFWKHGPYLEFTYNLWMAQISDNWFVRTSTAVHSDILFANGLGTTVGFGGGAALNIELVSFAGGVVAAAGVDSSGAAGFLGAGTGEWGFGLSAGVDYRSIDGAQYGVFQLGFTIRLPAAAGVVLYTSWGESGRSSGSGGQRTRRGGSVRDVVRGADQPAQGSRPAVEVRGTN